jgi:hypothetical protein
MGSDRFQRNDERYAELSARIGALDNGSSNEEVRAILLDLARDLFVQMRENLAEMRRVGEPTDDSPLVIRAGIGALRSRFLALMEQGDTLHRMLEMSGDCGPYHDMHDEMCESFGIDNQTSSSVYFGGKVHDPATI